MQFRARSRRPIRIDISALIDVVFLLLIFFAVSTSFLDPSGLQLELPRADTATRREPKDLTVSIGADGTVRFEGRDVSLEELEGSLRRSLRGEARKFVVVQADRNARLERVVEVMDLARKVGARGLTIAASSR